MSELISSESNGKSSLLSYYQPKARLKPHKDIHFTWFFSLPASLQGIKIDLPTQLTRESSIIERGVGELSGCCPVAQTLIHLPPHPPPPHPPPHPPPPPHAPHPPPIRLLLLINLLQPTYSPTRLVLFSFWATFQIYIHVCLINIVYPLLLRS